MPHLSTPLADLVNRLDALGSDPALTDIAQVMKASPLTIDDVEPFVRVNTACYSRSTVIVRNHYELVVITWLPGQSSVPHDHTGAICAIRVVQGVATESSYCLAPDGFVDLEFESMIGAGQVSVGQDAGVHSMRNASVDGVPLVTVHVYVPRLREYRRFVPRPAASDGENSNPARSAPTVVVIGGGFSGTATASNLLKRAVDTHAPIRVVLVERHGAIGEGVAYSTREPCHLLNVPAAKMGLWHDRPDDFFHWAARRYGDVTRDGFLPRQWYGEYLRETLQSTARDASRIAELSIIFDEVRRVDRHPSTGWMIHLARGSSLRADAVVLAIGHRPPSDPLRSVWHGPRTRYIEDPTRPFATAAIDPAESVVILGTGLTATDMVLSLAQPARKAPITLISRRGFLPHPHATAPVATIDLGSSVAELMAMPGGLRLLQLLRKIRREIDETLSRGGDWRSVVDGLRPHTATLWQALPLGDRKRFLAQLRPFWEVHRHRMAPMIADRMRHLISRGEVRVIAGRVDEVHAVGDDVQLFIREQASGCRVKSHSRWVINCTGPTPSNSSESNPAINSLLTSGLLRTDALGLGVETSSAGNAFDSGGQSIPDLFVVGTLRKPHSWESTAVPELRNQASQVAECAFDLLQWAAWETRRGDTSEALTLARQEVTTRGDVSRGARHSELKRTSS